MPKPEDVKSSQAFKLKTVIYNHDDFAIAVGEIVGNPEIQMAMRWNGEKGDEVGFPRAFNHSLWFLISQNLTYSILEGIKDNKELTEDEYNSILGLLKP